LHQASLIRTDAPTVLADMIALTDHGNEVITKLKNALRETRIIAGGEVNEGGMLACARTLRKVFDNVGDEWNHN
jgi:hypothetical protein